jgi:hypothetical protein
MATWLRDRTRKSSVHQQYLECNIHREATTNGTAAARPSSHDPVVAYGLRGTCLPREVRHTCSSSSFIDFVPTATRPYACHDTLSMSRATWHVHAPASCYLVVQHKLLINVFAIRAHSDAFHASDSRLFFGSNSLDIISSHKHQRIARAQRTIRCNGIIITKPTAGI